MKKIKFTKKSFTKISRQRAQHRALNCKQRYHNQNERPRINGSPNKIYILNALSLTRIVLRNNVFTNGKKKEKNKFIQINKEFKC